MFLDSIPLIILLCIVSISGDDQAQKHGGQPPAQEEAHSEQQQGKDTNHNAGSVKDPRQLVKDVQHIKEHLKKEYGFNDEQADKYLKQYDAQTQFFLMHDYDNNTKLDGLELLKSMTHHHDEDEEGEHQDNSDQTETLTEFVDMVMRDQDINDDGFIDYPEYISYYTKFDKSSSSETSQQSP